MIVRKSVFSRFLRRLSPSERSRAPEREATSSEAERKPEEARKVSAEEMDRVPFLQRDLK